MSPMKSWAVDFRGCGWLWVGVILRWLVELCHGQEPAVTGFKQVPLPDIKLVHLVPKWLELPPTLHCPLQGPVQGGRIQPEMCSG